MHQVGIKRINMLQLQLMLRVPVLCVLPAVALLLGCNSEPSLIPVRGKVTLDGEPLKTGAVITSLSGGRGAQGLIDTNGQFELGTHESNDGALVGIHKVAVVANDPNKGTGPEAEPGKLLVPLKYTNPGTSGLSIEVTPDGDNSPTLELTSQ